MDFTFSSMVPGGNRLIVRVDIDYMHSEIDSWYGSI